MWDERRKAKKEKKNAELDVDKYAKKLHKMGTFIPQFDLE